MSSAALFSGLLLLLSATGSVAIASSVDFNGIEGGWNACEACEWGVRAVQDYVADLSHQHAMDAVLDAVICSNEPSEERSRCEDAIDSATRQLVRAFENYVSPSSVCHPVCPGPPPPRAEQLTTWQCPFCEFIVENAAVALQNKTADEEVIAFVEQQCASLPPSFQDQCKAFVEADGQQLIDLLETTPPEKVCAEAGACDPPPSLTAALRTTEPSEKLRADVAEVMASVGRVRLAQTCAAPRGLYAADPPSEECQFCKVAVTEARAKIADPEFQHEAEVFLEKLCKQAGDYEEMCKDYIQEYAPLAFAMALDYLRPTLICVDLVHLCPKQPDLTVEA